MKSPQVGVRGRRHGRLVQQPGHPLLLHLGAARGGQRWLPRLQAAPQQHRQGGQTLGRGTPQDGKLLIQENGCEERRWGRQKCETQNNEIFKESKKLKIEEWRS